MGLGLALGPGYEVGESSAAAAARPAGGLRADYGFVATMDRLVRRDPERAVTELTWTGDDIEDMLLIPPYRDSRPAGGPAQRRSCQRSIKMAPKDPRGQHQTQPATTTLMSLCATPNYDQSKSQCQPWPHVNATNNGTEYSIFGTFVRGSERVARECTYQDFMKCKPLYFKGTEGVVELTQWFERMETVFRISNCSGKSDQICYLYSVSSALDYGGIPMSL
ncbi:hypothetical protein Tco_1466783 [Tanacetum coccineum]